MKDASHTDILFQQNRHVLIHFLQIPSQPWAHSCALLPGPRTVQPWDLWPSCPQKSCVREGCEEACQGFSPLTSELILAHFTLGASWATLDTCLHLAMYLGLPDPQADFPPAAQPCPIIIITTGMLMFRTWLPCSWWGSGTSPGWQVLPWQPLWGLALTAPGQILPSRLVISNAKNLCIFLWALAQQPRASIITF